jgi:MerR family transcriptional regulator, copper efflux regulator
MQIGQAAKASGISAKMIRHYEAIGLLPAAGRRDSGYRDYGDADLHKLQFIRRARDLGFSIERIRLLLKLWSDRNRSNKEVRALALAHVEELQEKVRHLQEMSEVLSRLAEACDGDGRPDCPIIRGLENGSLDGGSGRRAEVLAARATTPAGTRARPSTI